MTVYKLANVIACSLVEANCDRTNEGLLYVGVMSGNTLDDFNEAIGLLAQAGMIERLPGHEIKVTPKLKSAFDAAVAKGVMV